VALVAAIITDEHFRSESILVDVHGYMGVQSLDSGWGLHLRKLCPGWMDGLFQFSKSPVDAVQIADDSLPVFPTQMVMRFGSKP